MTIKEIENSIGFCGLVCKFCSLSHRCTGCKSDNNCCSKRLSPEGCYQYNCCSNKGLNGCWECADFPCGKDMFSGSHGIRLKAFVRCAKEDGLQKFAEYLKRNADNGVEYHKDGLTRGDYDNLEDEEQVLRLLRTGKNKGWK